MSNEEITELTQPQRDRLAFIELRLRFIGEIRRQDLVARFGIQAAAATRDIAQYKNIASRNVEYDSKGKAYVRSEWFRPVFEFPVERVLAWLSQGFGDGEPLRLKAYVPCEGPALLSKPDLETLSVLTRAIHRKCAVEIAYRALSSGLTTREIVPFALADNGLRWHVRAYDRRSGHFRDFVLTRIADASLKQGSPEEHEMPDQDIQWSRIVELELVPHPANVQHPDAIEADYGMDGGVLRIRVRAALAGYLLRRWNVDCTESHSLKGAEYHLWLRNHLSLVDVANLRIAPGYVMPTRSTDN